MSVLKNKLSDGRYPQELIVHQQKCPLNNSEIKHTTYIAGHASYFDMHIETETKLEDTKGLIRSRKKKDIQYNGQQIMDK